MGAAGSQAWRSRGQTRAKHIKLRYLCSITYGNERPRERDLSFGTAHA